MSEDSCCLFVASLQPQANPLGTGNGKVTLVEQECYQGGCTCRLCRWGCRFTACPSPVRPPRPVSLTRQLSSPSGAGQAVHVSGPCLKGLRASLLHLLPQECVHWEGHYDEQPCMISRFPECPLCLLEIGHPGFLLGKVRAQVPEASRGLWML